MAEDILSGTVPLFRFEAGGFRLAGARTFSSAGASIISNKSGFSPFSDQTVADRLVLLLTCSYSVKISVESRAMRQ